MEKDKIIDIIDNINIQDDSTFYNKVRLEIFKKYIEDFCNEVNYMCTKIGKIAYKGVVGVETLNIPDETQKYGLRFEYCLKIGYSEYISLHLNVNNLTEMIELFESKKDYIREEALNLVKIMNNNLDIALKKVQQIHEDLKDCNACKWVNDIWKFKDEAAHYHSGRASMIMPISLEKISTDEIEIPLYKPFRDEDYRKELDKIDSAINNRLAKIILTRYETDEKNYKKQRWIVSYDSYGKRELTPKLGVATPKLSLTEKYILVDYAIKNKKFELAEKLYVRKSNLPKHLKEELVSMVVMNKLIKSA